MTRRLVLAGTRLAVLAVLATLLLATSTASARRVVHIPTIAELCPSHAEWDKVAECVKRQAPFKLLRDESNLKLLYIDGDRRHFGGYYIFTHGKQWTLYAAITSFQATDLLAFEPVTHGARSRYRVDLGMLSPSGISLDGETTIPATFRYRLTSLCFGGGHCTQALTACDVLVRGRAYYTFRGNVSYGAKQIKIIGDRSRAGVHCNQGELFLDGQ